MTRKSASKPLIRLAAVALAATALAGCLDRRAALFERAYPNDVRQRHPIMVGPQGAYVASQCGLWPHDLGPSDPVMDMQNRPHWNNGCATQANFAAMVDNPNDLLQPRAEGPSDAARRQTVMGKYRAGAAPGTHTPHENIRSLSRIRDEVK